MSGVSGKSSAAPRATSRPSPASATSWCRPAGNYGDNAMTAKTATKLLIIDDDAHLRESLAEVLELDGFECHQAGDAKSGIAGAAKIEPQVVIMDIQLPDSSGFQICQELRK